MFKLYLLDPVLNNVKSVHPFTTLLHVRIENRLHVLVEYVVHISKLYQKF